MAIRRFREHVADQNWFTVLIDIGIVVIGVFLGIQASNWNASRLERNDVHAYQAQIGDDLKSNEAELAERLSYYRQVLSHALAAMKALENHEASEEAFLVNSYQASQVSPIRMERSAYDEMIASGMAKNFGDPAIRRRLSSYYAGTSRLEAATIFSTGYRERIRREMAYRVQKRIRERCSDVIVASTDGLEQASLPERCSLQLPIPMIIRAATDLSRIPGLEQELARHIGDLEVKIARFERWRKDARQTRQALERLDMS